MMKISIALISMFLYLPLHAQNLSASPSGEAGMFANANGGNPMLNLVMMDLRKGKANTYVGETLGSPYYREDFVPSKVYYGDEFQGDFFVRYNALNSIIEIKKTQLPEEEAKQLYADKNVKVKYLNHELVFTTFINKKGETLNGYLTQIQDGPKYQLYHRLAVKYSEGKAAANSMVADIPSRFAHFDEYYFKKEGVDRIDFLPLKKGRLLKNLDKAQREKIKNYIKAQSINLHDQEDLIRLFQEINKS